MPLKTAAIETAFRPGHSQARIPENQTLSNRFLITQVVMHR